MSNDSGNSAARTPYASLPDYCFWRRTVGSTPYAEIDPVLVAPFRIRPDEKIATAGSCFAQHLSARLSDSGLNFLVTETAHPIASPEMAKAFNYGVFTARYGNIYTSRQLRQLLDRSYGRFEPRETAWTGPDGTFVDPLRPTIHPGGYRTMEELEADRHQHLAAARRAFEQMDYFIFTLGLTECWISKADGTAFPVAPGVAGGHYEPDKYALLNLGVNDVLDDMSTFIKNLREINPTVRIILTVSPVPLVATAEDRHVLVSTTYSKSVLRVACDELTKAHDKVAYFPSYEMITSVCSAGQYFKNDWRSIAENGIDHVMRLFLRHFTAGASVPFDRQNKVAATDAFVDHMRRTVDSLCDEERIDP